MSKGQRGRPIQGRSGGLSAGTAALAVGVLAGALLHSGCERTPDNCANSPYACENIAVEDGPEDVYQLRVRVLKDFGSTTPLTPRQLPSMPLVYPLRFAIHFDAFEDNFNGQVTFEISALDRYGTTVGDLRHTVAITHKEHLRISVHMGPPFEVPEPDLAAPPEPPDLTPPPK